MPYKPFRNCGTFRYSSKDLYPKEIKNAPASPRRVPGVSCDIYCPFIAERGTAGVPFSMGQCQSSLEDRDKAWNRLHLVQSIMDNVVPGVKLDGGEFVRDGYQNISFSLKDIVCLHVRFSSRSQLFVKSIILDAGNHTRHSDTICTANPLQYLAFRRKNGHRSVIASVLRTVCPKVACKSHNEKASCGGVSMKLLQR